MHLLAQPLLTRGQRGLAVGEHLFASVVAALERSSARVDPPASLLQLRGDAAQRDLALGCDAEALAPRLVEPARAILPRAEARLLLQSRCVEGGALTPQLTLPLREAGELLREVCIGLRAYPVGRLELGGAGVEVRSKCRDASRFGEEVLPDPGDLGALALELVALDPEDEVLLLRLCLGCLCEDGRPRGCRKSTDDLYLLPSYERRPDDFFRTRLDERSDRGAEIRTRDLQSPRLAR
jgi:hypothetical protein